MPRIITNEPMKENIYRNIFEPLVAAYNNTQNVRPNPHEVAWVVTLLNARTDWWGTNMPVGTGSTERRGDPECCLKPVIPMCCRNGLISGARADRLDEGAVDTARTQALEKQLRTMTMDQPNAWQQWSQALDYFFNNCSLSLMYFTYDYKDGRFADFYENTLGLFSHPDSYRTGINIAQGVAGSDGPDLAKTVLTVDIALVGDTDKYFTMWSDDTNRWIIWFDVDGSGSGGPVVLPIGGITDHYVKVDLLTAETPADAATSIANQLAIAPSWAFAVPFASGISDVTILALDPGSKPASDGSTLPLHDTWALAFVDGDADPGAQFRTDCWQLWCAPAEQMADRFVVIYDTTGLSTLLYYDLDGAGTFVPPVGLIPDFTVVIPVTTGMTLEDVTLATAAALDSTGFVTTAISAGPYGRQTEITVTYTIADPVQDPDIGTVAFGVNYIYNPDLKGSDGSTLATGITTPEEYATAWNDIKVPFEATQGKTYPYLNPNLPWIGRASDCDLCLGRLGKCWTGNQDGCSECVACGSTSTNSVFRISSYLNYNIGAYNTPGNIFVAPEGRQANLTPITELV